MTDNIRDYKLLGPYRKLCEELDKGEGSCKEIYERFLIKLEKVRRELFPSVEDKQRQMTDDNLRSMFE